jgi:hypothetical protein
MAAYLTPEEFAVRSAMPSEDVRALMQSEPGFVEALLDDLSGEIDDQLRKRYAAPFVAPVPRIVRRWLTRLATPEAYKKRGFNPSSAQDGDVLKDADTARAEIQKAADSKDGLYELPLRNDGTDVSGVSKGAPLGYSEASPYTWLDRQADAVRGCR